MNRGLKNILSMLALTVALLWASSVLAQQQPQSPENLFSPDEVQSFNSGLDFDISFGAVELDPVFGFADGVYKLTETHIVAVAPNTYQLVLDFVRRKGILTYRHQENLSLLYDGTKLWFKRNGQIYRYFRPISKEKAYSTAKSPRHKWKRLAVDLDGLTLQLVFQ